MKTIDQEIATKSSIDLRMEVSIDGNTVIKKQADSLIANFLRLLYGMMGRRGPGSARRMVSWYDREHRWKPANNDSNRILNPGEIFDTDARIELDRDYYELHDGNTFFYLHSNLDAMEGWYFPSGDQSSFRPDELHEIDRANGTREKGDVTDFSGLNQSNWNGHLWFDVFRFRDSWRDDNSFRDPDIILGHNRGPRNAPHGVQAADQTVSINDHWLRDPIAELSTTGTSIAEPAIATNESEITLSRTFTNNQDYAITVGEIGVHVHNRGHNDRVLIARDNLRANGNDFVISTDSSVTVDYTITTSNSGGGGMMSQFHQQLYRQFTRNNRNINDINNNNKSNRDSPGQWIAAATGGNQEQTAQNGQIDGQYVGPVVGTSTVAVANTNSSIGGDPDNNAMIPHGDGDNELYYSSAMVEDVHQDVGNDEIYFDVSRLLENRGDVAVTVKETAHYNGFNDSDYSDDYPRYSVIMSRHVFQDSANYVDVQPGEVLKLKYRFKVTL